MIQPGGWKPCDVPIELTNLAEFLLLVIINTFNLGNANSSDRICGGVTYKADKLKSILGNLKIYPISYSAHVIRPASVNKKKSSQCLIPFVQTGFLITIF